MKRNIAILQTFWLSLVFVGCGYLNSRTENLKRGSISIENSRILHVTYKDNILIEKDEINYSDAFESADSLLSNEADGKTVINVIKDKSKSLQYRKEVAIDQEGRIELTLSFKLFPFQNKEDKPQIEYSFYVPYELLKNNTYKAYAGRSRNLQELKGVIAEDLADGPIAGTARKRAIIFEGRDGDLVFDFNPLGNWALGDYCTSGQPVGSWNIRKEGNYIKFSFGTQAIKDGAVFSAKVLIYKGKYDYAQKHAYKQWNYYGSTDPLFLFSFGTASVPQNLIRADLQRYNQKHGWGWENSAGIQLLKTKDDGSVNNCAFSNDGKAKAFVINVIPGYYVITLRICNRLQKTGPFDIFVNGEKCVSGISAEQNEIKTVTIAKYIKKSDKLKIEFQSEKNWSINSLAIQPVIYKSEDYTFDRSIWNIEGLFVPDNITSKAKTEFLSEKDLHVKISPSEKEIETKASDSHSFTQSNISKNPEADWRWNAKIAWMGRCASTRTELTDSSAMKRRIDEFVQDGYNCLLLSGLHEQHSFLDRMDEWTKYVKEITELAHMRGLKVVEHYDVTMVVYCGTGLHHFIKHLDWLQRDIRYDIPTFKLYCINNPDFRKAFLARLEKFVRETGVDGVMLDECNFAGKEFCGCEACRSKFTENTGFTLPTDDSSKVFFDKKSPIWTAWLKWRKKTVSDWWLDIRTTLDKVNSNASIMLYSTHYGISGNWASLDLGFDLSDCSRYCDFIGTEIMSRNVLDSYRAINAYRKIKSAIGRHYGNPVYGLIYHEGNKVLAYFGWALCHMNRQSAWMDTIASADMKKYIDWTLQMNNKAAKPIADVALLFSTQSRDFGFHSSHSADALGWSETLSDAHVMHEFLLDEDIDLSVLMKYKVLILPSSTSMNKKQINIVKEYVSRGGNLIVSGPASLADENGSGCGNFQLSDIIGIDYINSFTASSASIKRKDNASIVVVADTPLKVQLKNPEKSEITATIVNKNSNVISPAIVFHKYGNGKSAFLACRLGAVNYEPETSNGRKWNYKNNKQAADLLINTVNSFDDNIFAIKAVNIPTKVLLSAYEQTLNGKKAILVHLLNATGAQDLKCGDIVPGIDDRRNVFPAVEEDMVFDIKSENIAAAYAVSPDYEVKKEVSLEKRQNGYYRVTIPKTALKTYSIIYLY